MGKDALEGFISVLDNWAALFTLLVVIGVGGELVVHLMSSRANKKLIALQKSDGLAQEAEIARMKKDSASFELDIAKANKSAAEAIERAANSELELAKVKTPRSLINRPQILDSLKPYSGTEYLWAGVCAEKECTDFLKSIDGALQQAGWKRLKSVGTYPALNVFGDDPGGITVTIGEGIGLAVEMQNSSQLLKAQDVLHSPRHVQAAVVLNLVLAANANPPERLDKKPGKFVETNEGTSTTVRITVGKKVVP